MPPHISLDEQEKILDEATRLLATPANYISGRWKCPVYQKDKTGKLLRDDKGEKIPEIDLFNRPVHQHCIEGAVNQAAYNVLGEQRAIAISEGHHAFDFEGSLITDRLGLNALALEVHDYSMAMDVNDEYDSHSKEGHAAVLGLLKEQLKRVRKNKKKRR